MVEEKRAPETGTIEGLLRENDDLRTQLLEAEETLGAIKKGEVDAFVIDGPEGEQVFTLKGAESPYRIFIEEMNESAVTLTNEGTIVYCNRSFSRMVGIPLEKILSTEIIEYIPKGDHAFFNRIIEQSKRDKQCIGEGRIFIVNGDIRVPIHVSCKTVEIYGVSSTFLIITDITEHIRYEMALKRAQNELGNTTGEAVIQSDIRLNDLFRTNPIALSLVRFSDGTFIDVNQNFLSLFEYKREEVIGHNSAELNIYTSTFEREKVFRFLSEQGRMVNREITFRSRTGNLIQALISSEKVVFSGEERLLTTILDITGRKKVEESLRQLNVKLTQDVQDAYLTIHEQAELLNNTRDAIIVRDMDNRVLYWNSGARLAYGWTAKEVLGKKFDDFHSNVKTVQFTNAFKELIEHGEWKGELRELTKEGKEIIVDNHWTLMRDSKGDPRSIMVINTDITEKKRLESQFFRAQRMESIGTLASGIAHELNNLLTPIMLSLDSLEIKSDDEKRSDLIQQLKENIEKAANLTRRVLSFTRGIEGDRQIIQIKFLILEVKQTCIEVFPKNIEIAIQIAPETRDVLGDATQLHQVLMNLCVNARDAMPYGGMLKITASNFYIDENYTQMEPDARIGEYIVISVNDNGTGMSESVLTHIFEPFFTTKELTEGTGLGLSTVAAIVKSHGGLVNVLSEPGKGSTFKIFLPAIPQDSDSNSLKKEPTRNKGKGEMVLVVDDEPLILETTQDTLSKNGYTIVIARDGSEAIAEYVPNQEKISVVIVDMMMPVMNGVACVRALRKINPGVKIIGVSGIPESVFYKNIRSNVDGFILKPYTAEILLQELRMVISKK